MYAGLCFDLILLILFFSISRWSVVDFPCWPPAWASVMLTFGSILLLIILSNTFPKLLAGVIPRSLEHCPFVPFPLYSLVISPSSHYSGMFDVCIILFMGFRYICFVFFFVCFGEDFIWYLIWACGFVVFHHFDCFI